MYALLLTDTANELLNVVTLKSP